MNNRRANGQQRANRRKKSPTVSDLVAGPLAGPTRPEPNDSFPIEYYIDTSVGPTAQYANNFGVAQEGGVFHLTFAQASPPIIGGPRDIQRLQREPRLPSPVVARVVVPAAAMQQFLDLATSHWNQFAEQQATQSTQASLQAGREDGKSEE